MAHRILVVEPDSDTREVIAELLRIDGYEVDLAATVKQGLELLEQGGDRPCLILLTLPLADSGEFRRRAEDFKLASTIVITAHPALCEGVVDFLRKPFDYNDLHKLVLDHCGPAH